MMIPIFSFIGVSHSGKTTLLERIIKELNKRKYRVGVIKHTCHEFEIDSPGKDSWKFNKAGADAIIVSSPHKIAFMKRLTQEVSLEEIVNHYFSDIDLLLTEGYTKGSQMKIMVEAGTESPQFKNNPSQVIAVIEKRSQARKISSFHRGQVKEIVDFLEEKIRDCSNKVK